MRLGCEPRKDADESIAAVKPDVGPTGSAENLSPDRQVALSPLLSPLLCPLICQRHPIALAFSSARVSAHSLFGTFSWSAPRPRSPAGRRRGVNADLAYPATYHFWRHELVTIQYNSDITKTKVSIQAIKGMQIAA